MEVLAFVGFVALSLLAIVILVQVCEWFAKVNKFIERPYQHNELLETYHRTILREILARLEKLTTKEKK